MRLCFVDPGHVLSPSFYTLPPHLPDPNRQPVGDHFRPPYSLIHLPFVGVAVLEETRNQEARTDGRGLSRPLAPERPMRWHSYLQPCPLLPAEN